MSVTTQLKEEYIKQEARRTYYREWTITSLLHQFHPRFLEMDARWIGELLKAE